MSSLDEFYPNLTTSDTKKKLNVGQNVITFLENEENSVDCDDFGGFIDALVPWMQSSNFKVSQNGLDIVGLLVERLGHSFRPYLNTVIGPSIDRLGDTREIVREKANNVIRKLMESVIEPQGLLEKMMPAFSHKNGKVREEMLVIISFTLNAHGSQSMTISRFLPAVVALLSDPTAPVRDAAQSTMVEIYRHVGERVRMDLQKKHSVPAAKMAALTTKFDEVRMSGDMMPTATLAIGTTAGSREDETDRSAKSGKSRSSSVPAGRRSAFAAPKPPSDTSTTRSSTASSMASSIRRNHSVRLGSSGGGQAGAVDEESFIQAFEEVKRVTIYSGRNLSEEFTKIRECLSKTSTDWKVRVDHLQLIRSLLIAGAAEYDETTQALRTLEVPFQLSVKDLRSQVVREACITIAYMSQQLHRRVERFIEAVLQNLINLIPNSAKVMATSAIVCTRFIIQNTFSPRLIPILTSNISSKSRDIRRQCCEFMDQLLHTWPQSAMEKHVTLLQEAIKKGIGDADPDARQFARKAYWGFAANFKDQADILLNSLDSTYRRMLQAGDLSNSSSSNSLNTAGRTTSSTMPRSRQSSVTGSSENLIGGERRTSTLTRKSSGIPLYTSPLKTDALTNGSSPQRQTPLAARSNSAIDPSAARRAQVRAQYAQRNRMGLPAASLPRPRKSLDKGLPMTPDSRNGRPKSRMSGGGVVSQSQPGSRSTSPSSLKSYQTYFDSAGSATVGRRRSGIPRSTGPSREQSPNRFGTPHRTSRMSPSAAGYSGHHDRPPKRPVLTESMLRQSREAESALADALTPTADIPLHSYEGYTETGYYKNSPRKRSLGAFDDGSDESETSSLCSEKSFDQSLRRSSDDIGEIIANCASTHWADRKDGLIGLQSYFRDGRLLSGSELKRVTEIFTRMFMDAHTKVFSLFLDTLTELVVSHREDMGEWLYVLITRLHNKLGADLLGSIIQKINRTLDVVRDSFPYREQFIVILRFLVDQTQTPNAKVKVATMNYLRSVVQLLDPAEFSRMDFEMDMPLAKIITWSHEPKSLEVRRASQNALVAMFTADRAHFTGVLNHLPQVYRDNATELVDTLISKGGDLPKPSPSPMKPRSLQSPNTVLPRTTKSPYRPPIDPVDDSENMNPEDVHKSLRSTANAIQNYSFDSPASEGMKKSDVLDSKDSGISSTYSGESKSSVATAASSGVPTLEEKMSLMDISCSGELPGGSPNQRNGSGLDSRIQRHNLENLARDDFNLAMADIIEELGTVKTQTRAQERRACMTQLIRMAREKNTAGIQENFRAVLRLLLENLSDQVGATRALVYGVLTELLKQEELIGCFQGFTELIILKVLEAHKDEEKDVERAAEGCACAIAAVIPAEAVMRVLNPIIKTADFPVNQAAVKMLTRVAEHEDDGEVLQQHLGDIMPGLLKAYDNVESSVRKASVFCMVALHQKVGDSLQPHLESLNGSKLKLLNLYIKRAQTQSAPQSPRLTPP